MVHGDQKASFMSNIIILIIISQFFVDMTIKLK